METPHLRKQLSAWMGDCLTYPDESVWNDWETKTALMESFSPEAARNMRDFFETTQGMDHGTRQESYVHTFDVTPKGSLYLSVYLFGEENFKRAELMAGLKAVYEKNTSFEMAELPDHLAVVLKQNLCFEEEEWQELVSLCLLQALPKMIQELEKNGSIYRFILKACQAFLLEPEKVHV